MLNPTSCAHPPQILYEVFLSHECCTETADFARGLHSLLIERGITTFLGDNESKEGLDHLEGIVGRCINFVFILTDKVLASDRCLWELRAAIKNSVNIIFITKVRLGIAGVFAHACAVRPSTLQLAGMSRVHKGPLSTTKNSMRHPLHHHGRRRGHSGTTSRNASQNTLRPTT